MDRRLSGFAALSTSIRAILTNFWGIVGLLILDTLLGCTGLTLCCVGWYFVYPVTMAASVVAYRQVFPRIVVEDDWDASAPELAARPGSAAGLSSTDIRSETPPARPTQTGIAPGNPAD